MTETTSFTPLLNFILHIFTNTTAVAFHTNSVPSVVANFVVVASVVVVVPEKKHPKTRRLIPSTLTLR